VERDTGGRINFTQRFVDNLKKVRTTYWDSQVRGLGILTQVSGVASYFWCRRLNGKLERHQIGRVGEKTLDQARTKASEINSAVGKWQDTGCVGPPPVGVKHNSTPTVQELFDDYCAFHLARKPKADAVLNRDRKLFNYLAAFAARPIGTITRSEIRERHQSIGENSGPVCANRVLQLLQRTINWNIADERYDGGNVAAKIKTFPEFSRERVAQDSELKRLLAELDKSSKDLQDFVWLCLVTGQRSRSDVLAVRWADLSLPDAVWHVPSTTKTGRAFDVALSDKALAILGARWQSAQPGAVWVFPSDRSGVGRVTNLKRSWYSLLKRAGVSNLRVHDLRRVFATRLLQAGASQPVVQRGLGHRRGSSATAIYLAPGVADLAPAVAGLEAGLTKLLPANQLNES
jgi:integrase